MALATRVPEREDLDPLWIRHDTVEQVVANPREMNASHSREGEVPRESSTHWLEGDQNRGALELFANGVWRLRSILPPPFLGGSNLRHREIAYLDAERPTHSRLLSSARKSAKVVVRPPSHWAIDSRNIFAVSASASNVSSPSSASTVTDAPSGSSPSNYTRPATTFPEAIRISRL